MAMVTPRSGELVIPSVPWHSPRKLLLVARESGAINEYSIANVALRNRHLMNAKVYKMAINCNSTWVVHHTPLILVIFILLT